MKAQETKREKTDERISYASKKSRKSNYVDRRQQEMKRRFGVLQSRRSYLERELNAVKTGLSQLDQQMKNYSAYRQLSMQHRTTVDM